MNKRKVSPKRILAAALAVFMVVSLFAITPVSAAPSFRINKVSFETAVAKNNIIKASPSAIYYSRSSASAAWAQQKVMVANSVYNNSSLGAEIGTPGIENRSFADYTDVTGSTIQKVHQDGSLRYLDVTFDLGSVCSITDIAISGFSSSKYGNESSIGAYKLLAYSDKDDIDLASSLVYDYNCIKAPKDSEDPYLYQTYSGLIYARFVTIRITRATVLDAMKYKTDISNTVPRLYCGIFGKRRVDVNVKTGTFSTDEQVFGTLGASVVAGTAKVYYNHRNSSTGYFERKTASYGGAVEYLIDGSIENQSLQTMLSPHELKFAEPEAVCHKCGTKYEEGSLITECPKEDCGVSRKASKYYTDGSEHSVDIEYDLLQAKNIEDIVISHHKDKILQTKAFAVFASNSIDDLYLPESLVYERTNETSTTKDQIIHFNNDFSARYVAMRIYNPLGGTPEELAAHPTTAIYTNAYVRLLEFNIFGNEPYSISPTSQDIKSYTSYLRGKNSLIEGKNPSSSFVYYNGNKEAMTETMYKTDEEGNVVKDENGKNINVSSNYPNFSALTNDEVLMDDEIRSSNLYFFDDNGNIIDDETKLYAQFNYKLDAKTTVSTVELYGHSNAKLSPSHIRISVANNEADLFSENAVFSTGDVRLASNGAAVKIRGSFEGEYVGIRIICGCSKNSNLSRGASYMRIRELAVYGSYSDPAALPKVYSRVHHNLGAKNDLLDDALILSGRVDENNNIYAGASAKLNAPVSIRYNGEIYSFYSWTDAMGTELSQKLTFDYALKEESETIYANYKKITDKTVKFKFLDKAGNTIYETDVIYGHYLSRSQYEAANARIPSIPGYEAKKAEVSFGSRTAVMPVWSEDIYNCAAETEVSFTPVYAPEAKTYSVTFGNETEQYAFDSKVTFSNASSVYWLVNGVVFGQGSSLSFFVTGDSVVSTASSASLPVISLFSEGYVRNGDMTAFAKIVKQPYSIEEVGIIFAGGDYLSDSDYTSGSYSKMTVGAAGFITAKAKSYSKNNGFAITLKGVGRKRTRVARAYIKYKNSVLGAATTAYSNVIVIES